MNVGFWNKMITWNSADKSPLIDWNCLAGCLSTVKYVAFVKAWQYGDANFAAFGTFPDINFKIELFNQQNSMYITYLVQNNEFILNYSNWLCLSIECLHFILNSKWNSRHNYILFCLPNSLLISVCDIIYKTWFCKKNAAMFAWNIVIAIDMHWKRMLI